HAASAGRAVATDTAGTHPARPSAAAGTAGCGSCGRPSECSGSDTCNAAGCDGWERADRGAAATSTRPATADTRPGTARGAPCDHGHAVGAARHYTDSTPSALTISAATVAR